MSKERRSLKRAWKEQDKLKQEKKVKELEELFYIFNEVNQHKEGEDK